MRLSRLLKPENSNVNIVKNDPPDIFIAILCDNFLEKLIVFWEKLFLQNENFTKKNNGY